MPKNKEKKQPHTSDSAEKYYCGECGAEVKDGHIVCGVCNNKIDWDKLRMQVRHF